MNHYKEKEGRRLLCTEARSRKDDYRKIIKRLREKIKLEKIERNKNKYCYEKCIYRIFSTLFYIHSLWLRVIVIMRYCAIELFYCSAVLLCSIKKKTELFSINFKLKGKIGI